METHQGPYRGQNSLKSEVVDKALERHLSSSTLRLHQMTCDQVNELNNISVVTERERAGLRLISIHKYLWAILNEYITLYFLYSTTSLCK